MIISIGFAVTTEITILLAKHSAELALLDYDLFSFFLLPRNLPVVKILAIDLS